MAAIGCLFDNLDPGADQAVCHPHIDVHGHGWPHHHGHHDVPGGFGARVSHHMEGGKCPAAMVHGEDSARLLQGGVT